MRTAQWLALLLWLGSVLWGQGAVAQPVIQHALQVTLQPAQQALQVTDTITLPPELGQTPVFVLHAGLELASLTPGVHLLRHAAPAASSALLPLAAYQVSLPADTRTFTLRYQGVLQQALTPEAVEYRLGMRETAGLISPDGVYLSAATAWYPQFGEALLTFQLDVRLPQGWEAISQGGRTQPVRTPEGTLVRWESPLVQESMYLVAGPFTVYSQSVHAVQAMVFLRTPDAALARTYLEATGQYLRLYQALLGPYLYPKFALVENFWESGFGMPSFTLLGAKIIRLPFIVHSSYPHEILHNWWGNGVFIDTQTGNWAEGLTAYLADHLVQEQRGNGALYRRGLLQKYTHYVATEQDIALSAFRARHDAATSAIGYGKALLFFHMLRQSMGDAPFLQALRRLYRDYALRPATFGEVQQVFASVAGPEVPLLYEQWVQRPGAPELRIGSATVQPEGTAFLVHLRLEQAQLGPAYRLRIPVAVSLHGVEQAVQTVLEMTEKQLETTLRLPAPPRRLDVDPAFDVFRRLHAEEIPPAFSQLFGASRTVLVLPRQALAEVAQGYQRLAQAWAESLPQTIEIRWDDELERLPTDAAVWLLGWENRFRAEVARGLEPYGVTFSPAGVSITETFLGREQQSVALTVRHPDDRQHALAWVAASSVAAMPGLGRKLPHYGTYSFLGFTGEEPVNMLKGQWPVLRSPLVVQFAPADEGGGPGAMAKLLPRSALTSLLGE